MEKYRKLMIAGLGFFLIALADATGITMPWGAEAITNEVIAFLTAIGVWAAPNA